MANIYARSPFIVKIAETTPTPQNGSKLELFLYNGSIVPPSPTYTLSKLIPSPTNITTLYDISPYIREFIKFTSCSASGNFTLTPANEKVNVIIKKYRLNGSTYTQVGSPLGYVAFDGYTYYEQGANFDLGNISLDAGTYYYDPTSDAGKIQFTNAGVQYRNLTTNTIVNTIAVASTTRDARRVDTTLQQLGNKVEIVDSQNVVLRTFIFKALNECKYTPIIIDFVNRYGAWQREFFFKASNDNFVVENTEYNLMQTDSFAFNISEGQRKTFNANGKKSIKVNTGWVDETWKEVLKQIMLSEKILIDSKPAKINSKGTELFKKINTKQINYSLEFEFAYDVINSVI